jgi:uncharacterized CHY-type Zn-finger protein
MSRPIDCCGCQNPAVNLKCDTCQRFYCNDCWTEADDENFNWEADVGGLYHLENCDNCNGDFNPLATSENYYILHEIVSRKEGHQKYYVRRDADGRYYSWYTYWENNSTSINMPIYDINQ